MSDQLVFLVIEKLKKQRLDFYEAINGIRLILARDGETLWVAKSGISSIADEEATDAVSEFLKY